MTVQKIAHALCASNFPDCAFAIIPPWVEGADDKPAREAYRNVQGLIRQRDELLEIWPRKKDMLEEQFNESVMTIARDLYEQLYDLTP